MANEDDEIRKAFDELFARGDPDDRREMVIQHLMRRQEESERTIRALQHDVQKLASKGHALNLAAGDLLGPILLFGICAIGWLWSDAESDWGRLCLGIGVVFGFLWFRDLAKAFDSAR